MQGGGATNLFFFLLIPILKKGSNGADFFLQVFSPKASKAGGPWGMWPLVPQLQYGSTSSHLHLSPRGQHPKSQGFPIPKVSKLGSWIDEKIDGRWPPACDRSGRDGGDADHQPYRHHHRDNHRHHRHSHLGHQWCLIMVNFTIMVHRCCRSSWFWSTWWSSSSSWAQSRQTRKMEDSDHHHHGHGIQLRLNYLENDRSECLSN